MTLRLNGSTSGYVEIDAPAVAGSTSITLPATAGEVAVKATDGSVDLGSVEIDSSGRLLVGTASSSAVTSIVAQGNSTNTAGAGVLSLARGTSSISSGNQLGIIDFTDSSDNRFARIEAVADAATGAGDYPGRLVFSTTADGASSPTERMRIDSNGRLLVGTSSTAQISTAIFQGNAGGASNAALVYLNIGTSSPANGAVLGGLRFSDTSHVPCADVVAYRDGGTWTTGSSMPSRLVFSTTTNGASVPTERMRITNAGEVLINRTSNYATSHSLTVYKNNLAVAIGTDPGTNLEAVRFYNGTTAVGTISTTGSATAYNTSSDYRLKENVTPVTDGITRLQQLKPSRFNFIADPDTVVDGFIAHEVQTIVPEAITGEKDAVDEEGNPQYQGIDQSKLVPLLTAALQEAIGRIETLEAEVAALKAQ